jgi:hypothetical protein
VSGRNRNMIPHANVSAPTPFRKTPVADGRYRHDHGKPDGAVRSSARSMKSSLAGCAESNQ